MFTQQHEQLAAGIAAWASVALENARLYREAREADRLKDEFLAVLSHELRTPLNAIMGYARLLRGRILSGDKASRGLETLERNASALTQIVEDVLDISRIMAGKIRLDVQPVELPIVVHNAIATVQPAAQTDHCRIGTGPLHRQTHHREARRHRACGERRRGTRSHIPRPPSADDRARQRTAGTA